MQTVRKNGGERGGECLISGEPTQIASHRMFNDFIISYKIDFNETSLL